jgi:hypothetical protein
MRKLFFLYIPVLLLATASCTKNIQDLNDNPKAAITVPAASIFLAGQKNLSDNITTPNAGSAPFRDFAQTWTECTYITEARYILTAYDAPDNWWNALYGATGSGALSNFYNAKAAFPASAGSATEINNDLIITDIMEVYAFYMLVATYGDVPYSQADNPTIPFPKYDNQKTVFYDLLNRLDTCIADINTGAPAMGASDQLYGGSAVEWKKFAATLELKMAMMIADVDPTTANSTVQSAVTAGVFTSNADNALFVYQSSPTGNTNPIWQAAINSGRHDNCPDNLLLQQMVTWNDPRLPLYVTKAPDSTYTGGLAGNGNAYSTLSTFSAQLLNPAFPGDLLDYPETEFLLAEAAARGFSVPGTAAQYYDSAITASIEFWGGTAAQAQTYLAQPAVAYGTAPGAGNYKQVIGYQKWIHLWNRGWDAWTEIRRLGYPDINVISPPTGAISQMPLRFWYPLAEQTANPTNYAAAVSDMGGSDLVSTPLFWMTN